MKPTIRQRINSAWKGFKAGTITPRLHLPGSRSYAGANWDRLTEDFLSPLTTGDAEMRTRIRTLRNRARELERNEPYSRRYLSRLEDNVYDHHGITLTSLAGEWRKDPKRNALVWAIDGLDAKAIEIAYEKWKKNPFVTGDMTLNEGGRLALRSTARDGDVFGRWVIDSSVNEFSFAIQLLEADMCDDQRNQLIRGDTYGSPSNGQVRMGVEINPYFRALAYWLLKEHPGDQQWWNADGYWSERHDAAGFIHPFHRTRITQVRDVTWLCGIMRDLKMLDGYDEAAIVAARTGAAKMGFITRAYNEPGPEYQGQEGGDSALGGEKAMDAEPGLIEDLSANPGMGFEKWDPAYPHEQYEPFVKTRLRRIGAGLDMSYYAVANDLTEVNFSSIRAGVLEDREHFKSLQTLWINKWEAPIFLKWLQVSLMLGTIKNPLTGQSLPLSRIDKFSPHKFRPRRWPWVDPQKDVEAATTAINNRLKSRTEVVEENSQNTFAEVIQEQSEEQKLAESMEVELPQAGGQEQKAVDPDADEDEKGQDGKSKSPQK